MSLELAALLITSLLEMAALVYVGTLVHRTREKMDADDAARHRKRVEEVLREMRAELLGQ
jgi:hypothetical protein